MDNIEVRINALIEGAIGIFLREESKNILSGVSERNLCSRLAMVLSTQLDAHGIKGYYVDPEYNRKQNGQIKTILDEEFNVVTINCDLIVHSRGKSASEDNLIAIEMKKSNRTEEEKDRDRRRLRALTKSSYDDVWSNDGVTLPEHVCGYKLGVYIEINIEARKCLFEHYNLGSKTAEWSKEF